MRFAIHLYLMLKSAGPVKYKMVAPQAAGVVTLKSTFSPSIITWALFSPTQLTPSLAGNILGRVYPSLGIITKSMSPIICAPRR